MASMVPSMPLAVLSAARDVMTIVSGIVLASAAALAFIVQRARYLRETDVQLEVVEVGNAYHVGPPLCLNIETTLRNPSTNMVVVNRIRGRLAFSGESPLPSLISEGLTASARGISMVGGLHARHNDPLEIRAHFRPENPPAQGVVVPPVGASVFGRMEVLYSTPADLLMGILLCNRSGRRHFSRTVLLWVEWLADPDNPNRAIPQIKGWSAE